MGILKTKKEKAAAKAKKAAAKKAKEAAKRAKVAAEKAKTTSKPKAKPKAAPKLNARSAIEGLREKLNYRQPKDARTDNNKIIDKFIKENL
jgi:hypothetical protein